MKYVLFLLVAVISMAAFGQSVPDQINAGQLLLELVKDYKTMGPLGIGMSLVLLTVWILKTKMLGSIFKGLKPVYKRVVIVVLGQAYALLYMLQSGMDFSEALITGVFMSGGAMAIYESFKPFLPKKS